MRPIIAICLIAVAVSCTGSRPRAAPVDSISQRARDSAIGASRLPGAAGVRGALRAADSAAAHLRAADSAGTP